MFAERAPFHHQLRVMYRQVHDNYVMNYHTHPGLEVLMVHRARGSMFIDGKVYEMSHGAVFIFDAETIHYTNVQSGVPYDRTILTFRPEFVENAWGQNPSYQLLEVFRLVRNRREYCYQFHPHDWGVLDALLRLLYEERTKDLPLSFPMTAAVLAQILVVLNRCVINGSKTKPQAKEETLAEQVAAWIDREYLSPISLDQLAARFYVSKYHLCRAFKEATGFTILEYIRAKRILQAKVWLKEETSSVSSIANRLGFHSVSYFSQLFKNETGITPVEFRRRYAPGA